MWGAGPACQANSRVIRDGSGRRGADLAVAVSGDERKSFELSNIPSISETSRVGKRKRSGIWPLASHFYLEERQTR
jgi:hypothetical protein